VIYADTFLSHDSTDGTKVSYKVFSVVEDNVDPELTHDVLIKDQQADPELSGIIQHACSEEEVTKPPSVLFSER